MHTYTISHMMKHITGPLQLSNFIAVSSPNIHIMCEVSKYSHYVYRISHYETCVYWTICHGKSGILILMSQKIPLSPWLSHLQRRDAKKKCRFYGNNNVTTDIWLHEAYLPFA